MTRSHAALKAMRLLHLYLGVFTAPALLFFAFTGALQTFSLHETTRGSTYKPPQWAVVLGQIHKKQTPVVAVKKPQPPVEAASKAGVSAGKETGPEAGGGAMQTAARQHHPLPLKIFFLLVSITLSVSTATGVYMAYKYTRNRRVITVALILGAVIPLALVFV